MSEPIRFTTQKKQELISRAQLGERFIEFGWMPNSPEDLGEDFIVHIYFQGRATGVTFHVQEKSVTNLHERQKGDHLVYDFRVKDLRHWEAFSLPVVLIVWDIKLREGRWALLDTVISELDQRLPKWRGNKSTARVYIPWSNTTDDAGLVQLRQSLGRHFYPLIARDKQLSMEMKLNFPDTEEGRVAWKAFERFRREGEQATFRGRIIQELKFSEWAMPWLSEEEYLQLIDKLCTIQDKARQHLQVPVEGLTRADVQAIHELVEIIEHGKTITKHTEITGEFKGEALDIALDVHRQGRPIHFTVSSDESYVELFGLKIEVGRMTQHITGTIGMPITELEKAITALAPDEYLTLRFVDVEVVEIFPDWFIREARRLSQCLVDNFGAESVHLFGSLAWNDVHAAETDIDLAVSGLPAERYLEVVNYLERESSFPVDLVDLSKVPGYLRQRIVTEGRLLSEREPVMALS